MHDLTAMLSNFVCQCASDAGGRFNSWHASRDCTRTRYPATDRLLARDPDAAAEPAPAVDRRRETTPAGIPLASWVFAIRIWLAAILALYVSFWLSLEMPS